LSYRPLSCSAPDAIFRKGAVARKPITQIKYPIGQAKL
jgi:hypothetical protein